MIEALGVSATFVGKTQFDYLVVVDDARTLRKLTPDLHGLATIATRCVIVSSTSDDSRYDFLSRVFAPAAGIDEVPVTGSAHCTLAPYWAKVFGKTEMTALQLSARQGVVGVRVQDDRVILSGQAVTVLRGELLGSIQIAKDKQNLS